MQTFGNGVSMSLVKQKYILLRDGNQYVRCSIKRIVCIVSKNQQCHLYEWVGADRPARKLVNTYRLGWFSEQITDPHFFEIFRGTVYNTRFYLGHDNERIIQSRVEGLPQLVVSSKLINAFRQHLTRW